MANWHMTPYNKARAVISGLFLLVAIVTGLQAANGETPLPAHLFFAVGALVLSVRGLYSFWKGK